MARKYALFSASSQGDLCEKISKLEEEGWEFLQFSVAITEKGKYHAMMRKRNN